MALLLVGVIVGDQPSMSPGAGCLARIISGVPNKWWKKSTRKRVVDEIVTPVDIVAIC